MNSRSRIITGGSFKGSKIEIAATDEVDRLHEIADEFMKEIFDFEPEDYAISDESILYDFIDVGEKPHAVLKRIQRIYNINVSDIEQLNLKEIFKRLYNIKAGKLSK